MGLPLPEFYQEFFLWMGGGKEKIGVYLEQAKKRYAEMMEEFKDLNPPYQTTPCGLESLEFLEQELGLPLPAAYQEFLLWMGYGAERFMDYMDFCVGQVSYNQEDACELIEDYCQEPLPDDAIVFAMSAQGYFFYFIRVSEGDDPPVHSYGHTEESFAWNTFPNLNTMILSGVESRISRYQSYRNRQKSG